MEQLKIVFDKIILLNKNVLFSEVKFSDRIIDLEDFIDEYKIKKNISVDNKNNYLVQKYNEFINNLEIHKMDTLKIKLAYTIDKKLFRLFVFDENLQKILSYLELTSEGENF